MDRATRRAGNQLGKAGRDDALFAHQLFSQTLNQYRSLLIGDV
jgi:hypothetical protein